MDEEKYKAIFNGNNKISDNCARRTDLFSLLHPKYAKRFALSIRVSIDEIEFPWHKK